MAENNVVIRYNDPTVYYVKDWLTGEWREVLKQPNVSHKDVSGTYALLKVMRAITSSGGEHSGGMFHMHCSAVRRSKPTEYGSVKTSAKRKATKSAVATAAYNARAKLYDEERQEVFDFSNHSDKPAETGIIAPASAPKWVYDRDRLWNEVQKRERGARFLLSRSWEQAFPLVFSPEQRKEAVEKFCKEFTADGYVCDFAIHAPEFHWVKNPLKGKLVLDDSGNPVMNRNGTPKKEPPLVKLPCNNPHVHIQTTIRGFDPSRADGWKKRKWRWDEHPERGYKNRHEELDGKRQLWADCCNEILKRDFPEQYENLKLDPRSYKKRGIEKEPTKHLGTKAMNEMRKDYAMDFLANHTVEIQESEIGEVTEDEIKAEVEKDGDFLFADEAADFARLIVEELNEEERKTADEKKKKETKTAPDGWKQRPDGSLEAVHGLDMAVILNGMKRQKQDVKPQKNDMETGIKKIISIQLTDSL